MSPTTDAIPTDQAGTYKGGNLQLGKSFGVHFVQTSGSRDDPFHRRFTQDGRVSLVVVGELRPVRGDRQQGPAQRRVDGPVKKKTKVVDLWIDAKASI